MFERKDTYTIPEGMRERMRDEYPCLGYRGKVKADPDCYLSRRCRITGDVEIGYHATVYEGAVIRGDSDRIVIGAESNIQENCVLHVSDGLPLLIGEHTTVGHGAILHGCRIGDNTLVGMGAIVLDGARIGDNCVIGAGALVTEGMEVPDRHMAIGVPARLRGPMPPEKIVGMGTYFGEANLVEAANMHEAGLLEHPSRELLRLIGGLPPEEKAGGPGQAGR